MMTRVKGAWLIMGLALVGTTPGCGDDPTRAQAGGHADAESEDGGDTDGGADAADVGAGTLDDPDVDAGQPDSSVGPAPDAMTPDVAPTPVCEPGQAEVCGTGLGVCEIGARTCLDDGTWSPCVAAIGDRLCTDDTDCGGGSACVTVVLDPRDSLIDDCTYEDREFCLTSVCAVFEGEQTCELDDDCDPSGTCVRGWCLRHVTTHTDEVCNGLDDNCDGLIDDDFARFDICGPCPYGMVEVTLPRPTGADASICVDRYEASRPMVDGVESELYAASVAGAVPWTGLDSDEADRACRALAYRDAVPSRFPPVPTRRLCDTREWQLTCAGPAGDDGALRLWPWAEPGETDAFVDGAAIDWTVAATPALTGSAPLSCLAPNARERDAVACDLVGNVGEWVRGPGNVPMIAGGSFADIPDEGSGDISLRLSCGDGESYPTPLEPLDDAALEAVGFRCCAAPVLPR